MGLEAAQLAVLTVVHIMVDLFAGILPAVLPVIREEFLLSLPMGVLLISSLNLASNGMQLATGHLRSREQKPLFLHLGLAAAGAVTLVALMPRHPGSLLGLVLLVAVAGTGIAVVHPEALRAIHALKRLPGSVTTAVFMVGGSIGFAGGAWVSSLLVTHWGLRGLLPLLAFPLVAMAGVVLLRVRLATDQRAEEEEAERRSDGPRGLPFWPLMYMAVPTSMASAFAPSLLPTCLHERGFSLQFGGFSTAMFGAGYAVGAVFWGLRARSKGELPSAILALLLGSPFLWVYLLALPYRPAVILLFAAGFCGGGAFPLIVTLARSARGPVLGKRMAFAVGGSWGVASILLLAAGPVAERVGIVPVLVVSSVGYLAAAAAGTVIRRHYRVVAPVVKPVGT